MYEEVQKTVWETVFPTIGQSFSLPSHTHALADEWAEYRLVLNRPVSVAQSDVVRRILNNVAPARCRLAALDFTQALNLYAGTIPYDGSFTYGVA